MTESMERQMQAQLRAWGQSAVPLEAPERLDIRARRTVKVTERALRGVAQRRKRRSQLTRWGIPLVSAAACIGLFFGGMTWYRSHSKQSGAFAWASGADATQAEVRAVDGGVVARRDGTSELLRDGARLRIGPGDVLSTPPNGKAEIGLDDGGQIALASATEFVIPARQPGAERFDLNMGRVTVDVPPNPHRPRILVIQTPDVQVSVHGTSFVVDVRQEPRSRAMSTAVSVTRGTVWILREGHRLALLNAGDSWSSARDSLQSAALEVAEERRVLEEAKLVSAEEEKGTRLAKSVPSMRLSGSSGVALSGSATANPMSPAPDQSLSGAAQGASTATSDQLKRENRQFQTALRARNVGNDQKAVRLLEVFLNRYPSSVLAQEAQVERFRALKRLGRDHDAEHAARQYLAEHDDGFARREARDIALSPRDAGSESE